MLPYIHHANLGLVSSNKHKMQLIATDIRHYSQIFT